MKKITFFISMILVSAIGVFAQATEPVKVVDNPNAPEISFEKLVHDYGTIPFGGDGVCTFKFKNTGKEPLILQQPQSSCGCTVPTWPKEPVLPGASDEIQVTYNTKKAGPINKTVTVRSNAKTNTIVLRITGTVQPAENQQLPEKTPSEGTPVNK
ncbi:MAG: DUF1573 domain-containing protein [Bacteroidales bacterium]|jgi:hypothetical protein|nr:DUF1573 domain-containing protein [Bacteroidales bacterium]